MTLNSVEMVKKINHVKTSRYLIQGGYSTEDLPFPESPSHEEQIIKNALFQFLKSKYVGCKLRVGDTILVRLDASIHLKAQKLRQIFEQESEWKNWFENNHPNVFHTWRANRTSLANGSFIRAQVVDEKHYVYVPYKVANIQGYYDSGLSSMLRFLSDEHTKDSNLAAVYEDAIRLMEAEIERRETEKRQRIERELSEYMTQLRREIFKPATELQESSDPVQRLFAQKVINWARENGKAPEYAVPVTYKEMVPTGSKVQVMNQEQAQEENWYAVPMFEGYEVPEGFTVQDGWGEVTRHDEENERSRGGQAPIVVETYIFLSFDMEHWKHLLPAEHAELLAITEQFRQEALLEGAPLVAAQRAQEEALKVEQAKLAIEAKKREEEARKVAAELAKEEAERMRLQVEAERTARQESDRLSREEQERAEAQAMARYEEELEHERQAQARRTALAEQLRLQVTQAEVPYTPPQLIPSEEASVATEQGIYTNMRAIPLERYVVITPDGAVRRYNNARRAAVAYGLSIGDSIRIRDYHAPHETTDIYEYAEEADSEF